MRCGWACLGGVGLGMVWHGFYVEAKGENTDMIASHSIRFYRSTTEPGVCHAACSCVWAMNGDLKTIQTRAATHDLDEPVREALLKKVGFVSGLPDKLIGNNSE